MQESKIEIAPVFHRLPERIRAQASPCFTALILNRVMGERLKRTGHAASPETVLTRRRRSRRQSVSISQGVPISGTCTFGRDHTAMLAALKARNPGPATRLSLL